MITRDQIPAAIVGRPPQWWAEGDDEPLAWGPFAAERGRDVVVGCLLREIEPGVLGYQNDDRAWRIADPGEPVAKGNALAVRGADGAATVFRPVRESDARYVLFADDGRGGTLLAKLRRALNWDPPV